MELTTATIKLLDWNGSMNSEQYEALPQPSNQTQTITSQLPSVDAFVH